MPKPLTDHITTLIYDSGDEYSHYYLGFEERRDGDHKVRLYWEEGDTDGDDWYWQCFTARSALDDDGNRLPDAELIDWAKGAITARRLENSGSFIRHT